MQLPDKKLRTAGQGVHEKELENRRKSSKIVEKKRPITYTGGWPYTVECDCCVFKKKKFSFAGLLAGIAHEAT